MGCARMSRLLTRDLGAPTLGLLWAIRTRARRVMKAVPTRFESEGSTPTIAPSLFEELAF